MADSLNPDNSPTPPPATPAEPADKATPDNTRPTPATVNIQPNPPATPAEPAGKSAPENKSAAANSLETASREDLVRIIGELREESASKRVTAKQAREEVLTAIKEALGEPAGDQPPTIEQITGQLNDATGRLETAEQRATRAERMLAVHAAAPDNVDVNALLDSNSFMASLDTLSLEDGEAVRNLIAETIKQDARFTLRPQAGSGYRVDHSGSGTPRDQNIPLEDALAHRGQ